MFAAGFLQNEENRRVIILSKVVRYPRHAGKRLGRKLLTLVIVSCISIAIFLYAGQALIYWQASAELERLHDSVDMLSQENLAIKEEIILLQDEDYLEIMARKELGLVRPGEILFSVGD